MSKIDIAKIADETLEIFEKQISQNPDNVASEAQIVLTKSVVFIVETMLKKYEEERIKLFED